MRRSKRKIDLLCHIHEIDEISGKFCCLLSAHVPAGHIASDVQLVPAVVPRVYLPPYPLPPPKALGGWQW